MFNGVSKLLKWIKQKRAEHQRRRAAVNAAMHHFQTKIGKRSYRGVVVGEDAGKLVVRICYGAGRPPRRRWFLVDSENVVEREMSFEEVKRFGERAWR